ncbi:hypothetical protein T03_1891 [Trichinella britovi]|uniref:Uncharacterized protein n=1 Tax=Trichinella britovi TaxID=45882 RepID=A0A0V0Z2J5_TRIBR|nr:hypothetical protein T03_1891 [Trichinella britovi]
MLETQGSRKSASRMQGCMTQRTTGGRFWNRTKGERVSFWSRQHPHG